MIAPPQNVKPKEKEHDITFIGWRCFVLEGPIPFDLTGVVAGITTALANKGIEAFVVSTFSGDCVMVKSTHSAEAESALSGIGYAIF